MKIALGADHAGFELKGKVRAYLQKSGHQVQDEGTVSNESVDYPDFAYAVAQLVASGQCANGIVVDGAGIGSCMTANKVPGVRAAMCYDHATATNSREHNHANVLTLGAGLIGANLAKQIVQTLLDSGYGKSRLKLVLNRVPKRVDVTPEELEKIEERMRELAKANLKVTREEMAQKVMRGASGCFAGWIVMASRSRCRFSPRE